MSPRKTRSSAALANAAAHSSQIEAMSLKLDAVAKDYAASAEKMTLLFSRISEIEAGKATAVRKQIEQAAYTTDMETSPGVAAVQHVQEDGDKSSLVSQLIADIEQLRSRLAATEQLVEQLMKENGELKAVQHVAARTQQQDQKQPVSDGAAGRKQRTTEDESLLEFKMAVNSELVDPRTLTKDVWATMNDQMGIDVHVAEARVMNAARTAKPASGSPYLPKPKQQEQEQEQKASSSRAFIWFKVADARQAEEVVRNRRMLKGSGITIFDFLSSEEMAIYKQLKPKFDEAIKAGKPRTFFKRARLFIGGEEVTVA